LNKYTYAIRKCEFSHKK